MTTEELRAKLQAAHINAEARAEILDEIEPVANAVEILAEAL